jgi:preprotein translocase subunit SecB
MSDATATPDNSPNFSIKGQYIKDLSFENPRAPASLVAMQDAPPRIDLNVDIKVDRVQETFYETALHISARATGAQGTLFLTDLVYAGLFELVNIPEDRIEPILFVDCPFVLYPFARRVIADVTRDGGFPPLMLEPIDFQSLYIQNRTKQA